jgi:hypothetical protein
MSFVVVSLIPGAAIAQQPGAADARAAVDRARAALELPRIVDSVRKRGIPESEINVVLGDVMRRGVPANETRDVLLSADSAIKRHGPVDNFGAFVQGRLQAGLRGRELARAIREEHAKRGKGRSAARTNAKAADARDIGAPPGARDAREAAAKGRAKAAENSPSATQTQQPTGAAARRRQADSIAAKAKGKRP